jgi:porin
MQGTTIYLFLLVTFCLPLKGLSQKKDSLKVFQSGIAYTGEVSNILSGGIQSGTVYLGMVNINLSVRLWKGASIFLNGANTHGGEPSSDYIGDYQVASNIEAGNHTYLQELWIRQEWKSGEITIGLQDLNIDYANTNPGLLFLNSSFGIIPTISANVHAPVFPLTSLGISSKWQLFKKTQILFAAYDGEPTDFSENPHNLKWDVTRHDGLLMFSELQQEISFGDLQGKLKAGVYAHHHFFMDEEELEIDSTDFNNYGFYALGEQQVWTGDNNKSLDIFFQLGICPERLNHIKFYIGGGFNFNGLFSRKGNDALGIAVAHVKLKGIQGEETAIELTYQLRLKSVLFLQPDIQYIINPSGSEMPLENALVATLRFGLNL